MKGFIMKKMYLSALTLAIFSYVSATPVTEEMAFDVASTTQISPSISQQLLQPSDVIDIKVATCASQQTETFEASTDKEDVSNLSYYIKIGCVAGAGALGYYLLPAIADAVFTASFPCIFEFLFPKPAGFLAKTIWWTAKANAKIRLYTAIMNWAPSTGSYLFSLASNNIYNYVKDQFSSVQTPTTESVEDTKSASDKLVKVLSQHKSKQSTFLSGVSHLWKTFGFRQSLA